MEAAMNISLKSPKIALAKSVMYSMGEDEIQFLKVKDSDAVAYEALFRNYYSRLCHFASSIVDDMYEAEEIVQGIFLTIWEKRIDLVITSSFKSYIYQAVKNKCLNFIRNKKTQKGHLSIIGRNEEETANATDQLDKEELSEKLYLALENLPPKCKLIFQLSRFEGLKHQEIADKLDLKTKTVENQIGIALKFLRNQLSDYLHLIIFFTSQLF
jgi:RNA polymerase sigma-70 factor (family 1)